MAMTRPGLRTVPPASLPGLVKYLKAFRSDDPSTRFAVAECLVAIDDVIASTRAAHPRARPLSLRLKASVEHLESLGVLPIPAKEVVAP